MTKYIVSDFWREASMIYGCLLYLFIDTSIIVEAAIYLNVRHAPVRELPK